VWKKKIVFSRKFSQLAGLSPEFYSHEDNHAALAAAHVLVQQLAASQQEVPMSAASPRQG
jgi:hypothetical protein